MSQQGLLLVVSGPSGAGKGTICRALMEKMPGVTPSVSATTRKPRVGEVDGREYFFLNQEKFQQMIDDKEFLEWAQVFDNFYGSPRKPVETLLNSGQDVILEIDIQGALQIKKHFPDAVFIFILPPSFEELKSRITKRGTDSPEVIEKRLKAVSIELSYVSEYDYVIINDEVESAVQKLMAIIAAEKCRVCRKPIDFNSSEFNLES